MSKSTAGSDLKHPLDSGELERIREAVENVDYGSVLVSIQDGKIVQIEKNEKIRLK
jgi:hypothetical protein